MTTFTFFISLIFNLIFILLYLVLSTFHLIYLFIKNISDYTVLNRFINENVLIVILYPLHYKVYILQSAQIVGFSFTVVK